MFHRFANKPLVTKNILAQKGIQIVSPVSPNQTNQEINDQLDQIVNTPRDSTNSKKEITIHDILKHKPILKKHPDLDEVEKDFSLLQRSESEFDSQTYDVSIEEEEKPEEPVQEDKEEEESVEEESVEEESVQEESVEEESVEEDKEESVEEDKEESVQEDKEEEG